MSKEEYKNQVKDETIEEKPGGASRLGREAKIGVTVIGLLVIVLSIVIVVRLRGSSADDKATFVADRDDSRERTGHETKADALFKESRFKPFGAGTPTAVQALAAPAKAPKPAPGDLDPWRMAENRAEAKRTGGSPSANALSPLMPAPPKPKAERRERHAIEPPDAAGFAMAEAAPAMNRDLKPKHAPAAGRYTPVDAAPPPPMDLDRSRYEPPAALSHTRSAYSAGIEHPMPTMAVAQYDSVDDRAEPQEPRHIGGGSRRPPASLYNPRAARREDGKYEVQPNDNYWTISERLYGTGAYFKALAQQNRSRNGDEDGLHPGELILAPTVAELEKTYPDLCPKSSRREALQSQNQSRVSTVSGRNAYRGGRTYTVVEGDTLFNIARYELGKASRWAEIYDLNRDVLGKDFNYLTPGVQLVLPDGERSDVMARQPNGMYPK